MLANESGPAARLDVASVAGGRARTLFRAAGTEALHFQWEWTADGKAILVKKGSMPAAADELWLVPSRGHPGNWRSIFRTAPYMHDGSLATLEDVVEHYNRGGRANPFLDVEIRPLTLTETEKLELVAFLVALSGTLTR